jgi:hypothetical protein
MGAEASMTEHDEQSRLMLFAAAMSDELPELGLLYSVPNGGRRDIRTAIKLKQEGVKAGLPDLCLPVARGGHHGAYIEMKYGANGPDEKQKEWLACLREQGYFATVCWGWQEAADVLQRYLAGEIVRGENNGRTTKRVRRDTQGRDAD